MGRLIVVDEDALIAAIYAEIREHYSSSDFAAVVDLEGSLLGQSVLERVWDHPSTRDWKDGE